MCLNFFIFLKYIDGYLSTTNFFPRIMHNILSIFSLLKEALQIFEDEVENVFSKRYQPDMGLI